MRSVLNELRERTLVNVGEDTTLGNGDVAEELVQLLIVADGELKVTRDDTGLLVVTSGVSGQLEDLGCQVLEDGGQVDGGTWQNRLDQPQKLKEIRQLTSTDTLGVVALPEETVDTTDWECKTGL